MAVGTTIPATPPFAPGALMWRRYGPLPVWGYAAILVGGLLVLMYLRRGKAADQAATAAAGQDASTIAANTPRSPIFILPQTGLQGPAGPVGPSGPAGPGASPTDTVPPAPPGSGRDSPPGNPFINADGTLSVGAGANLYDAADSAGLSGPPGHAQFAALNPAIWKSNTKWGGSDGKTPFAVRGMPYRVR
jgi:hypothetical protein